MNPARTPFGCSNLHVTQPCVSPSFSACYTIFQGIDTITCLPSLSPSSGPSTFSSRSPFPYPFSPFSFFPPPPVPGFISLGTFSIFFHLGIALGFFFFSSYFPFSWTISLFLCSYTIILFSSYTFPVLLSAFFLSIAFMLHYSFHIWLLSFFYGLCAFYEIFSPVAKHISIYLTLCHFSLHFLFFFLCLSTLFSNLDS